MCADLKMNNFSSKQNANMGRCISEYQGVHITHLMPCVYDAPSVSDQIIKFSAEYLSGTRTINYGNYAMRDYFLIPYALTCPHPTYPSQQLERNY